MFTVKQSVWAQTLIYCSDIKGKYFLLLLFTQVQMLQHS